MTKSVQNILKKISYRDAHALKSIYDHRCLNGNQIYELHYMISTKTGEIIADGTCKKKIKDFLNWKIIKKTDYINEEVYFLTSQGVDVVRIYFNLPTNIYDENNNIIKRGYYRANELEIYPKYIHHQINLNQFVIDFKKANISRNWRYYDEKFVSQYSNIRPDGMITMYDVDFFLEMDMSTESKKQLYSKWDNYRNFLISQSYAYKERRIIMLFIVESAKRDMDKREELIIDRVRNRINIVRFTIYERLLDLIDSNFEIYVGTKDDILNVLSKKIVPCLTDNDDKDKALINTLKNNHGFQVSTGDSFKNMLYGTEFNYYIRKTDQSKNIVIENNRIQEYFFDDYYFSPASVLSKIAYLNKTNTFFHSNFNRSICYIVMVDKEDDIFIDLKMVDLIGVENVFFTTLDRLNTLPFHKALFSFNTLEYMYSFTDNGLEKRIFEKCIGKEAIK